MIAHRAMLDVPRELVLRGSRLLRAERRARGTRRNSRALTCAKQALLGLVWFRKHEEMTVLAAGFGVSRATAYRYRDELITVLAAQAPDLHEALESVAAQGWPHVILDGKVFRSDRCAATTSAKGRRIDSWYSGKHHAFGGNVQAIMRPDGFPIWTSPVVPGHQHDMTAARTGGVLGALYSARCTRRAVLRHPPVGERGFALLTTRWRALQRVTASPSKIGDIVAAGLVLTHSEHAQQN